MRLYAQQIDYASEGNDDVGRKARSVPLTLDLTGYHLVLPDLRMLVTGAAAVICKC